MHLTFVLLNVGINPHYIKCCSDEWICTSMLLNHVIPGCIIVVLTVTDSHAWGREECCRQVSGGKGYFHNEQVWFCCVWVSVKMHTRYTSSGLIAVACIAQMRSFPRLTSKFQVMEIILQQKHLLV